MSPASPSLLRVVVDPHADARDVLAGFNTNTIPGAPLDAVLAAGAGSFDAVILEAGAALSPALDLLRALRSALPAFPVIVLTSIDDPDFARLAIESGAQDCLVTADTSDAVIGRAIRQGIERARVGQEARALFDADFTANFVAGADGAIQACNATFAQLLRFADVNAALRTNAADLFEPREAWSGLLDEISASRSAGQRELVLRAADGTRVHVLATAAGHFDARRHLLRLRGQFYDLTAHKQLELRFSQLQKFEAIGRLAGGIAHDFNNLLTLVAGGSSGSRRRSRPGIRCAGASTKWQARQLGPRD